MPRNADLPKPESSILLKNNLLTTLQHIDASEAARSRILSLETEFRKKITTHVTALPPESAIFAKFNTNPFVLMFYAKQKGYRYVSDIEKDILPAKLFSSMETSAGRMVQTVVLPVYGWESVESTMHSVKSVIDARRIDKNILHLATLKSGPRCLNDEMSKDIADDIVAHSQQWADEAGVDQIEFTYAVLYGTPKQSNKKDWHILRNIVDTVGTRFVLESPKNCWKCSFRSRGVRVNVSIRIGTDWWNHMGGELTLVELLASLIRACVVPAAKVHHTGKYTIADLAKIVSVEMVPEAFNVSILQHSQLEWLFFLARHYCDELV